jgi:hypothetical protein
MELALWSGSHEEYLLNPDSGIVFRRTVGELNVVHGDCWQVVRQGQPIPADGWLHRFGCTCPLCR